MAVVAIDASSDLRAVETSSPRTRPFISPTLLFCKRCLEAAVLDAVQTKPGKREGESESWEEIAQISRAWIERDVDPRDREEWLGSYAWCVEWLGLFGCRNLFGVARERGKHYTGERKKQRRGHVHFSGNPRHCADELRARLRAMREVSELRAILLAYIDEARASKEVPDDGDSCPADVPIPTTSTPTMPEISARAVAFASGIVTANRDNAHI